MEKQRKKLVPVTENFHDYNPVTYLIVFAVYFIQRVNAVGYREITGQAVQCHIAGKKLCGRQCNHTHKCENNFFHKFVFSMERG